MKTYSGNVTITKHNAELFADLTHVGGSLYIRADAKLDALTSVGGSLDISADAKLDALTSVGGSLVISADAKLDALTSVGGSLVISADAKLDAPLLARVANHDLPAPEVFEDRIRAVCAAALASDDALNMSDWHTCNTTHCIAGWAIHLAGEKGYELEDEVGGATAGAILLGIDAAHHFHESNAKGREWLISKAA